MKYIVLTTFLSFTLAGGFSAQAMKLGQEDTARVLNVKSPSLTKAATLTLGYGLAGASVIADGLDRLTYGKISLGLAKFFQKSTQTKSWGDKLQTLSDHRGKPRTRWQALFGTIEVIIGGSLFYLGVGTWRTRSFTEPFLEVWDLIRVPSEAEKTLIADVKQNITDVEISTLLTNQLLTLAPTTIGGYFTNDTIATIKAVQGGPVHRFTLEKTLKTLIKDPLVLAGELTGEGWTLIINGQPIQKFASTYRAAWFNNEGLAADPYIQAATAQCLAKAVLDRIYDLK
jgi:hypothetical protein